MESALLIIGYIGNVIAIVWMGFWLHRDMANLRERMAKLEGAFDGFLRGQQVAR